MTTVKKWPAGAEEDRLSAITEGNDADQILERLCRQLDNNLPLLRLALEARIAVKANVSDLRLTRAPEPKV